MYHKPRLQSQACAKMGRMVSLSQAKRFERTREAHRYEIAEDYVEVILDLVESVGEARLTDIAAQVGVAHPTVSKALKRLELEGLVALRAYRSVQLTAKGKRLAVQCRSRHQAVVGFLRALGLDNETAEADAEGIEHHLSPATLNAMKRFLKQP